MISLRVQLRQLERLRRPAPARSGTDAIRDSARARILHDISRDLGPKFGISSPDAHER